MDVDPSAARQHIRYYRTLAGIVALGLVAALILATGNVRGPGWFTPEASFFGLSVAAMFVAIALVAFLLRIGSIFELESSMQKLYDGASERAAAEQAKIMQSWDAFREDLRKDMAQMRQEWRSEQGVQDRNTQDAANAARAALKSLQDLESRFNAYTKEPSNGPAIERLNEAVANLSKEVQELRTRDRVNSPLLKELQEAVAGLVKNQTKLIQRIDTTIESMERREMENASLRASAERELGDVKRREALLAVKTRELEGLNEHLELEARQAVMQVQIGRGEERQHVITIEGIGPAFATRLNAIGIITIPQLVSANPEVIGPKVEVTPDLVREWQSMADLMRLKGVGPQYAELLVRGGVRSAAHLAAADPDDLSQRLLDVERGRKVRVQGGTVSPGIVKRWIDAARTGSFDAE